ncbi:MAG: ACT domain-containing protein [Acholeplasma sp.]|jgi:prephenate dehydratase|nr:MAG: ACT domain-containing protein [Acholeplasma sp.]
MNYVVLGPQGTFSDLAYQHFQQEGDTVIYEDSIEKVFKRLGEKDYAIVPIENTLEGYIQTTLDGLIKYRYMIINQMKLAIDFSLISHTPSVHEIKRIFVQFAAKGQCQKLLESFENISIHITDNNTQSYHLMKNNCVGDAAIVPTHMVKADDVLIRHHVADSRDNWTRFILVGRKQPFYHAKDMRVSLVITPINDRPGLLYDLLGVFKKHDINLTSIMSRPTKSKMGHYHFFIDLIAKDIEIKTILQVIELLQSEGEIFIYGIYPHLS